MSNDVLSDKLNANFSADINKELYDFTGEFNYMLCYDKELDYYAIYNMDSAKIMERSNGNVYDGFLEYQCYYGGYSSYFYQDGNTIYSITDEGKANVDDVIANFKEYSEDLMQESIDDSQFKSRENIKTYVEKTLYQDGVVISKCDSTNHRDNVHYINDGLYSSIVLANNFYADSSQAINGNKYCIVENYKIGFDSFTDYDGNWHVDTIFPVNSDGTCGLTAATMLLQYYERQGLLRTVAPQLYSRALTNLSNGHAYDKTQIVSEILHAELVNRHNDILDGSTYTTVKDAIKKYFADYGIVGLSATSSASWWGLKSAIDNDDPCVIFVGVCTLYHLNNNFSGVTPETIAAHAMYTYGYTLSPTNIVEEYICHTGWTGTKYFNSITYVAKTTIVGNVRLLY